MLTRSNFGTYLRAGQNKLFNDSYEATPHQFTKLFQQFDIKTKNMGLYLGKSFSAWSANTEGSPIATEDIEQVALTMIAPKRYDKGYTISYELLQDDEFGVYSGNAGIGGNAKALGRSLYATIETIAANVLSDGFTTPAVNGENLFATNHKPTTPSSTGSKSNKLTVALDEDGLKAAAKMVRSHTDHSGTLPIGAIPKYLIVHPNDEYQARAILNPVTLSTLGLTTSAPNLELVVLDYLANDNAFFVKAGNTENLAFVWRERPTFGSQPVSGSLDWLFYGYTRMAAAAGDWRGIVGSVKPSA
ncbi:phage major capsid protein [Treponema sp. R6D11]